MRGQDERAEDLLEEVRHRMALVRASEAQQRRSDWARAACELLEEAGHRRPVRSGMELAHDLGIEVHSGERERAARLILVGGPPVILVDERMGSRLRDWRVAVELGRYALLRAGYDTSELATHLVAEQLVCHRAMMHALRRLRPTRTPTACAGGAAVGCRGY